MAARRNAESLSDAEHEELCRLTDAIEATEVDLIRLAVLRRVSLDALIDQLGLATPARG